MLLAHAGYSLQELEADQKELFDTSFEDLLQQMKEEEAGDGQGRGVGGEGGYVEKVDFAAQELSTKYDGTSWGGR